MEETESRESSVVCQNSQGLTLRGHLTRLGRHEVVFEIYNPAEVLQTSEVLGRFEVFLQGRTVYSGRAVVTNLVHTNLLVVCEASLQDGWKDLANPVVAAASDDYRRQFEEHLRGWQKHYRIIPEYKLHIADMQSFFTELRLWLEQVELAIPPLPAEGRMRRQDEISRQLAASILPCIDALFEKFEHIAKGIDPDAQAVHRVYMQRQLHPLLLCCPFAHRTFTKPLGYAGDYEMVNMISRNTFEGGTLYAQIVNLWFLRQPPAEAHRNRLVRLTTKMVEETLRVSARGRPVRIFSVACGPAVEVQEFICNQHLSERAEITLLDFNKETLEYIEGKLAAIKNGSGRKTRVNYVQRSVLHILKESGKSVELPEAMRYDFVYCAGLFDYLTDTVCQRLMSICYRWLAPGGLLLATNVDASNPLRRGMEYLLDWTLIYRTAAQLQALRPTGVEPGAFLVNADLTGVNLFMEARKPKDE